MTYITHNPEPMFDDVTLAYQAFAGPRMAVLIEPDRLGPVNNFFAGYWR